MLKRLLPSIGAALLGFLVVAPGVAAAPWEVDPKHSYVQFEVVHLGLIPYPGRFKKFTAKLDYDPNSPETSSVEVRIPVKSLETDDGLMNETMLSEQLFDERNFQEMRFVSTRITRTSENTGVIEGELTMKGNTHPIKMDATFAGEAKDPITGAPRIGITAVAKVDRVKWGVAAWRGFVDRTVTIRIGIEASPK